jgi:proton-dependent oligopeptide transporter, POT family
VFAPRSLMGAVFLSLFVSNKIIGRLGGFYETMTPSAFWLMHAGIATAGAVLAMATARPLRGVLGAGLGSRTPA